jgi:hypothetical protein
VTRTGLPKLGFHNTSRGRILPFFISTRQRQNDTNGARVTSSLRSATMKWRSYVIFGLLSLVVSALSVVPWMINPFTDLLLLLAAPPLRLLGYHPPVQGWSGLGSAMLISFLWPLTLTPLHWLNFRLLRWKKWGYAGLLLLGNLLITGLVLMVKEGS